MGSRQKKMRWFKENRPRGPSPHPVPKTPVRFTIFITLPIVRQAFCMKTRVESVETARENDEV